MTTAHSHRCRGHEAGKYAATEVPAALTLEECWELVNISEQTGVPCMMLRFEAQRQSLSHASDRPDWLVDGHQPRRPFHISNLDEQQVSGPEPLRRETVWPRQTSMRPANSLTAMSITASS